MFDSYEIKRDARTLTKANFPGVAVIPLIQIIVPICLALLIFGKLGLALFALPDEATFDTILYLSEAHQTSMFIYSNIFMNLFPLFTKYWETNYLLHITNNRDTKVSIIEVLKKTNFKVFVTYVLKNLVASVIISLWTLLFIVPGVIKSFSYLLVPYIAIDRPELGIFETLKESERLMYGNRFGAFNMLISFIFWYISIPFTLGLSALYVQPYTSLAVICLYNDLMYDHKYSGQTFINKNFKATDNTAANMDNPASNSNSQDKPFDLSIYNSQTLDEIDAIDNDRDDVDEA